LEQARLLKRQTGTTPTVVAIAEATGLTVAQVRAALLYASVMGR
jgi:predicted flavoprotein YhiN